MTQEPASDPEVQPVVPALARAYLDKAVTDPSWLPSAVRIRQEGTMWLSPGGRAMPFTATQDYLVARPGFQWRARFRVLPLVWLDVVDEFRGGNGRLVAKLWGLACVMHSEGEATSRGEAMRYLSELFWMPHSIAANRDLRWRDLDERTLEVSTDVQGSAVAVQVTFDETGDIAMVFAPDRPRPVGKAVEPTPWRGRVWDYGTVAGVRIPRQAEVAWELPQGPFTYWRGRVTGLDTIDGRRKRGPRS